MLTNSLFTTSINFCPGFTPLTTSSPIAFNLTSDIKSFTTDKLTSASNKALLTSFNEFSMLDSLILIHLLSPLLLPQSVQKVHQTFVY